MIDVKNCAYKYIKNFYSKSETDKQLIIANIESEINSKSYDFGKIQYRKVKGKRTVATYGDNYTEIILAGHLFSVLSKMFHIRFANRESIMSKVFDFIDVLPKRGDGSSFSDFSLVRFDFHKFFYSISSRYVYEKFFKNSYLSRENTDVLKSFVDKIDYCIAGIPLSNIFAEIIACEFDSVLKMKLNQYKLIVYERYIDDGIIVTGQYISKDDFLAIINDAIKEVFYDSKFIGYDKNKVALSLSKYYYLSSRDIHSCNKSFNFLGYDFSFDDDLNFEFGITQQKITKYETKIENVFSKYYISNPVLIKYFVKCFSSRVVYKDPLGNSWVNKGIVATYRELRRHINNLDAKTSDFLMNVFKNKCIPFGTPPKYIQIGKTYNLYDNLKDNRAIIFNEIIGYSFNDVSKMISSMGKIPVSTKDYDSIVNQFLREIRIGKIK